MVFKILSFPSFLSPLSLSPFPPLPLPLPLCSHLPLSFLSFSLVERQARPKLIVGACLRNFILNPLIARGVVR